MTAGHSSENRAAEWMMASDSSDYRILSALVSDELVNARLYGKETNKKNAVCVYNRKAAASALSHLTAFVSFLCCVNEWKARPKRALKGMFCSPITFRMNLKKEGVLSLKLTYASVLKMIWILCGIYAKHMGIRFFSSSQHGLYIWEIPTNLRSLWAHVCCIMQLVSPSIFRCPIIFHEQ